MKCPYCERRLFGRAFCPTHGKVSGSPRGGGGSGGGGGGNTTGFYTSINYNTNADVSALTNSVDDLAASVLELSASSEITNNKLDAVQTKIDKVYVVGTIIWYSRSGWPCENIGEEGTDIWIPENPYLAPAPSGWSKTGNYDTNTNEVGAVTMIYAMQIRFLGA